MIAFVLVLDTVADTVFVVSCGSVSRFAACAAFRAAIALSICVVLAPLLDVVGLEQACQHNESESIRTCSAPGTNSFFNSTRIDVYHTSANSTTVIVKMLSSETLSECYRYIDQA